VGVVIASAYRHIGRYRRLCRAAAVGFSSGRTYVADDASTHVGIVTALGTNGQSVPGQLLALTSLYARAKLMAGSYAVGSVHRIESVQSINSTLFQTNKQ